MKGWYGVAKKLKLWNGRAWCVVNRRDPLWPKEPKIDEMHVFACGESRADIMRMMEAYCGVKPGLTEIVSYGSPYWGNVMNGIEPERGIWIQFGWFDAPVRVWPLEARSEPLMVEPPRLKKPPKRAKKRI